MCPDARHAPLPERIWIVGPCGAGKTTLARRVAQRLGVAPLHIDDIHWRPGWQEAPRAETYRRLDAVSAGPRWVIDGNYRVHRARLESRIDLLVWLDFPLHVTFPRLVRRCVERARTGELVCNGNRETWRGMLFERESILLWSLTSHAERKRGLLRATRTLPHVRLRSPRDVDRWWTQLAGISPGRP